MVKHGFDCLLSFSEPPEIRTVEGFSAVFAFARCEHRLCSQSRRATNCATPRYLMNGKTLPDTLLFGELKKPL